MKTPPFIRDLLLGLALVGAGVILFLSSWLLGPIVFVMLGIATIGAGVFAPFHRKRLGAVVFLGFVVLYLSAFVLTWTYRLWFANG